MPMTDSFRFILGSQSPRRRELLGLIVPPEKIQVVPSRVAEARFEGLADLAGIETRLRDIARRKGADVWDQVRGEGSSENAVESVVIAADTIIVVEDPRNGFRVLGQPPADETWKEVVRTWFRRYYSGRTHRAMTVLCVSTSSGRVIERLAVSEVTFIADVEHQLEWYVTTGESRGKAGGYAIQGAGSVFVEEVRGSLSNVVGLPLEDLLESFKELGIDVC